MSIGDVFAATGLPEDQRPGGNALRRAPSVNPTRPP